MLADPATVKEWSLDKVLEPYLTDAQTRRSQETAIVQDYLRRSFDVLIARSQAKLIDYERRAQRGTDMGLSIQDKRRHLDNLRRRQAQRLVESQRAAALALGAPEVVGVAAVVPVELAASWPDDRPRHERSDAVEEAAMAYAMAQEQERGWQVEDIHDEDRGYDLVSHSPTGQIRYVEVKGRAGVGDVELSQNEWLKAQQLGDDYWLYVISNALTAPDLQRIQNPTQCLSGDEVVKRVRYPRAPGQLAASGGAGGDVGGQEPRMPRGLRGSECAW